MILLDERPYDPLTATRFGSYYGLMAPQRPRLGTCSPAPTARPGMIDYLAARRAGNGHYPTRRRRASSRARRRQRLNGLRDIQTILRRDRAHALAGFDMGSPPRDDAIGGEGSRVFDGATLAGRSHLLPDTAGNAMFPLTLCSLLIQDWDVDAAGKPHEARRLLERLGLGGRRTAALKVSGVMKSRPGRRCGASRG